MRAIVELIARLHDNGLLSLPERSSEAGEPYEFIQPSKEAEAVGERVRQRVLANIGLTDIGSYISRERSEQKLDPRDISREIRLSSDVLMELESSRLPFFELSSGKAADLVEALDLDPSVLFHFLGSLDVSQRAQEQPAPLLRTDSKLNKDQRSEIESESLESSGEMPDTKERLDKFVREFVAELTRRGILKP